MTTITKSLQSFVLPFAFGAAAVRIAIDLTAKIALDSPLLYYLSFVFCFVLEIAFITYVTKTFKSSNDDRLTVQQGLKIGLIIMVITGLLYSIASYTYDTYIDPEFQSQTMLRLLEEYNPAAIEETKAQMELSKENTSKIGILTSTIWFVIVGFVISLVTSNVLKSEEQ